MSLLGVSVRRRIWSSKERSSFIQISPQNFIVLIFSNVSPNWERETGNKGHNYIKVYRRGVVLQNSTTNGRDQSWGSIHNEELESRNMGKYKRCFKIKNWVLMGSRNQIKREKRQNRMINRIDMLKENKEFNN